MCAPDLRLEPRRRAAASRFCIAARYNEGAPAAGGGRGVRWRGSPVGA